MSIDKSLLIMPDNPADFDVPKIPVEQHKSIDEEE